MTLPNRKEDIQLTNNQSSILMYGIEVPVEKWSMDFCIMLLDLDPICEVALMMFKEGNRLAESSHEQAWLDFIWAIYDNQIAPERH